MKHAPILLDKPGQASRTTSPRHHGTTTHRHGARASAGPSSGPAATEEVELKLQLAPAEVRAFRRLELLKQHATHAPRTLLLRTTYFDTPEQHLRARGLELRVRHVRTAWIQTLKTISRPAAGLHRRMEWETPVDGPQPSIAALAAMLGSEARLAKVLDAPSLAQRLVPIFDNVVRRTLWPLRLPDGTLVELALDQGELRSGDAREPISEVELELKAGHAAALFDFALQLQETVPLRVGNQSKSARGYALHTPAPLPVACARHVRFDLGMTIEAGFQVIAQNCLAQVQGNELGVMHGTDPESVHQMRVGLRRLRSALRLFSKWMPVPGALHDELGWLAGELGAARDAEVLAENTLPALAAASSRETPWQALRQAAAKTARANRHQAAAAVGSVRYSRLMLGFMAWVQGAGWRPSLDPSARKQLLKPLGKRTTAVLARLHQKLVAAGQKLATGTPEERHRARIAAKRLRYAMAFFQSLERSGPGKHYIERLTALQDALGRLNDAAVADGLLRRIGQSEPTLADSARQARAELRTEARRDTRKLLVHWKQFKSTKLS